MTKSPAAAAAGALGAEHLFGNARGAGAFYRRRPLLRDGQDYFSPGFSTRTDFT